MKKFQAIIIFGIIVVLFFPFIGPAVAVESDDSTTVVNTYDDIKKQYKETLSKYRTARNNFLSMRIKSRAKTSTVTSEELFNNAKNSVQMTSLVIIKYLELVELKLNEINGINEEERNRINEQINSEILAIQEKMVLLDNAKEYSELSSIASLIQERWVSIKNDSDKRLGYILTARTRETIMKLEQARINVQEFVAQLEKNNQGVGNLNSLLEKIDENLAIAKIQVSSGEKIFVSISSTENGKTQYEQGKDFLTSANKYIRSAWQIFRSSVSELRKRNTYRTVVE